MPRFAANITWMFNEYDFVERFAAAGALGFRAAECQFPYPWEPGLIESAREQAGLPMIMFNSPPGNLDGGEYGLAALPGRQSDFHESIMHGLAYADALDCTMLHVLAGIVPESVPAEECLEVYVENMAWAARTCERYGVTVLIEPINTFERPGYLISTSAAARQVIDRLDRDNVAMQFDFHNAQLMEGNLTSALTENLGVIRHMQIAGVPNRTPPDQGEMNYPYLFDLVDRLGYEGWLGCEFRPGESTEEGLKWARGYGLGSGT